MTNLPPYSQQPFDPNQPPQGYQGQNYQQGQQFQQPYQPQPKKTNTVLIVVLIAVIGIPLLAGLGFFLLAATGALAILDPSIKEPTENSAPIDDASALSYVYGETAPERIIGVDVSGLRTDLGFDLVTNGNTAYTSPTSSCIIGVTSGYAPDEYVGTGDDEKATLDLLEYYSGKDFDATKVTDRTFVYKGENNVTGAAPVKYLETEIQSQGEKRYAGVQARIITGGGGQAITILTSCATQDELDEVQAYLETSAPFWATESKY